MAPGMIGVPLRMTVAPASTSPWRVVSSGSTDRLAVVTKRSAPAFNSSQTPVRMASRSSGAMTDLTPPHPVCRYYGWHT